jgi:hypothetical protein
MEIYKKESAHSKYHTRGSNALSSQMRSGIAVRAQSLQARGQHKGFEEEHDIVASKNPRRGARQTHPKIAGRKAA